MKKFINAFNRVKEISNRGGKIFIRGAGGMGKQLFNEFCELGIDVNAFIDTSYEALKSINGVPIYSPDYVYRSKQDTFFIIVAIKNLEIYKKVAQEMQTNGLILGKDFADFGTDPDLRMNPFTLIKPFPNRYELQKYFFNFRVSEMQQLNSNFSFGIPQNSDNIIASLDFVLTTYCSLKCSFCLHCIPYCQTPKHYNINQIVSDLDKLLSVSKIGCIGLMGGEPFMHPQFLQFLKLYSEISNFENIGFTRIVTNGTIVPSDEIFQEYAKIKNTYIFISNYGKKSKKISELIDKCKQFGILYYLVPAETSWVTLGDFNYDRLYTEKELRHLFSVCDSSVCVQLIDGHLYSCARTPILNDGKLIPYSENDFCDIRNISSETLEKSLNRYLFDTPFLNGCKYCDGQHVYSAQIERGF